MKIVIVLCSIATFAIAVPVHQENDFESSNSNQALSTKRERKSAFPDTPGLFPEHGIETIPIHNSKKSSQSTSVEAKSFRRPIIIKRKLGYHVYRDSDEEMAYSEPGEKCREQVKFKLCDHEPVSSSKNGFKSPTFKCFNNHNSDNEMENSIKMAKEAVEHLQKDLKRMENFSPKIANPHIEDIESNTGLHHDIEIAREALEHIEQNFESKNLEVNNAKDLQISMSQDGERLTRWREAIENIHKNFEIVKDIEDAFKSDNHISLFRSDSGKTVELQNPEHLEGLNDNLENNEEAYNEDKILKSASNEDGNAHLTPKTENLDDIGKGMGNDMFVSPTENREEKLRLHSDSLKSDNNNKNSFLRSDVREIESIKRISNAPEETIEYVPKKSLSEIPNYSEHEKSVNDHISDDYELLPKVSSSSSESLEKNPQIEEKKTFEKSELMMKAAFPDRDNRNLLIRMKPVKEILGNKKEQEKTATSNEENINEYGEMFKSENENSPLERLSLLPSTNIEKMSTDIENFKNAETGREENVYSDNNKVIENQENESKSYNTNMRISNDQLEKTDLLSAAKYVTIDQDVSQSAQLFSLKEKERNALGGEENVQNKHKTPHTIKENHEFQDFLKATDKEVNDEAHKRTEEYKNIKSSEVQDRKIDSPMIQNQELNKFSSLNDDLVKKVDKSELYKTVSEVSNEAILNDRDFKNQHSVEEEMRISMTENKDSNEDSKLQFSKSVPELYSDLKMSMPTETADISDDQHSHQSGMRLSQTQNEKLQLNEYLKGDDHASTSFDKDHSSDDTKTQSFKSVPELKPNPKASLPTDKVEITNDEQFDREEASIRSSESQNEKMRLNENQELHEPLPIGLNIERHAEERTWQSSKSVPELTYDPMLSMPTENVDITDDQHAHKEEAIMRLAESPNGKKQSDEIQEVYEPLTMGLDINRLPEVRTWQLSKSVPELPNDPMVTMATGKVDIIDDHHAHKGEDSMRSSESHSEKLLLNQGEADHSSMRLENEYSSDDEKSKFLKSVPELQLYPIEPLLTEQVDFTNDPHSHREEASMRSSEKHNDKMQLNEYQELHESLMMGLDFERHPEERTRQSSKSAPEQPSDSIVSMQTETIDITDDHHAHKEKTNMRSSESQSDFFLLNEQQDEPEHASTKLDIERSPDDTKSQFSKSVPELLYDPMVSMPTNKLDITDDQQARKGEVSTRSSESQSEKSQLNEYEEPENAQITSFPTDKEVITNKQHLQGEEVLMRSADSKYDKNLSNENLESHEPLPMGLDIERHTEERTWQSSKSVPELLSDSMISMAIEKVDINDDHHAHKEEASMRSSESQNEKLALNEYQDESEHALSKLDIENSPDDMKSLFLKSVAELESHPLPLLPTDKVDITNNRNLQGEGMSMRSAEVQNEKYLSNENQEVNEPLPMGLNIERHPDEHTLQFSKSVPELSSDSMISMQTKKTDNTDDHHPHKEETNERSSESQSEKLQLNEYQNESERASTKLDIENSSDDKKSQFLKSVPELLYDSMESMPKEKVDISDDRHALKEEPIMRLSGSQSEKLVLNEYQEEADHASTKLDIENSSDDKKSLLLKSVPELLYDSMVSMPKEKVDITDDRHSHKEEASMKSSESHSEKLKLNKYQDEPKHASTKLDFENSSEDKKSPLLKSVPELLYDPMVSMPTENVDITYDHQVRKEEASMRSSEIPSEKLELNENQDEPERASTKLNIENSSDDKRSQFFKSIPELPHDPMISLPMEKVDITDDHAAHKGEAGMRSSESQSEKLEVNEYQAEPEHASMKLAFENNSDDIKPLFLKSVSDLSYDPMVSMPTEKVDITNDQHALKEEPSMRSSEIQSEKLELNEYQDEPGHALSKLDIENNSDDGKSQFLKSVSELESYSLASFPLDKVDITNNRNLQREEETMRSAEVGNEKNHEVHELRPMGLNIERHPEERTLESSKSVPEPSSDPMILIPTEKLDTPKDHYSYTGDASMRVSETNQEGHEPLRMRLDMTNHPEDRKSQVSKSVPELPLDSMVSMPTDKVEITYDQKSLKEENMRLSQNQNEGRQFHESYGQRDFFPTKLGIDNHPEYSTQLYKSAPELYTTRSHINHVHNENSYFPEDARLSQNQNERQMYFNQHLYEPFSSRTDNEKKLEDEAWTANKARFSYMQNPLKEETNMRLSQNENENKEILYPSRNLGLSNEHMNREENAEHMNDFMHPSVAQHQQLHDNHNPMLRWSNERQHLNHNFKSRPEHKMLPLASQFEFSNGQNVPNEYMRMNEQQSRDPEPIENQNSLSIRWNTANQHQDPSSKTFKFNTDFDHTLHKSNEFDNQQFIPHEASKSANTLEYRTRSQLFGDNMLDDTQASRLYQTKQNNDHFANYYKTIPEGHEEYMNPQFRNHVHRVAVNHNLNDADTLGIHDSPSNRARLHEHMLKYHQEKSPNLDSSMDPSMHMSLGEPFAKSGTEFNNINFNHPHGTARFGAALPIGGINSGPVGVYPTANAGGCGIPLFLSCNPSVVSGGLARSHIGGPILKSVDENFKYYMKRDAKNVADIQDVKIQASFPHSHGTGTASEI